MSWSEVVTVLDVLRDVGCRFWLEGGWGVDALVGRQTRPHRDVDLDLDGAYEEVVLARLGLLGYVIDVDRRPNRVELVATGRGRVDVHPLEIRPDGSASQAALDGGRHEFPADYFTHGSMDGRPVPCVSVVAQRAFREGYELRAVDRHDLAVLATLST